MKIPNKEIIGVTSWHSAVVCGHIYSKYFHVFRKNSIKEIWENWKNNLKKEDEFWAASAILPEMEQSPEQYAESLHTAALPAALH